MKDSWTRQYSKPVAISASIFAILLVLLVLAHDFWYIGMQCQSKTGNFSSAKTPSEQATSLANLFRVQGWVTSGGCADKAKALFDEPLSAEQRLALFDANQVTDSDLIVLVQGLYSTQANVDQMEQTSPLLQAMSEGLDQVDETTQPSNLKDEINRWLKARDLVRQEEYSAAKYEYDKALELNSRNRATLYERAHLLNTLDKHEEALADLEQVMTIAQEANEPASDQISQETRALIEQDSELADALHAAPEEQYPILKEMMASTPMATATVGVTEPASPTSSPTQGATATAATPTSTVLTVTTVTPTSTLTVTPTSTLTVTPTSTLTVTPTSTVVTVTPASTLGTVTPAIPLGTVTPANTLSPQPTATVQPSNTPLPSNTPIPSNTPFVATNTPLPSNTPFVATNTPPPSNTPFVATNTPIPSNTPFVATNTPIPSNTPFVPTNTPIPSNTPFVPTNTPIPSNTPFVPTNTPIPTNTPFVPTNTPIPTSEPAAYARPMLLAPENGVSISNNLLLQWSWNGTLQEDEHFDVRVWREGEPAYGIGWTKETSYLFYPSSKGDGNYFWSVTVIRGQNGQWQADLSDPATPRLLNISGAPAAPATSTPPP